VHLPADVPFIPSTVPLLYRHWVGRGGDPEQGPDPVQREPAAAEGLPGQGQLGEAVADPEQVGGGVVVEARLDGEPVRAGADAGAAPAGAVVEGGEAQRELGM
jgi:hypothetical protein